jgi:hypothetical protein
MQIFGIFMARDLKALGLLPASQSNELQKQWNAVIM